MVTGEGRRKLKGPFAARDGDDWPVSTYAREPRTIEASGERIGNCRRVKGIRVLKERCRRKQN